jgi:uncharacterized protein YcbK (DUF882 family)
VIDRRRLLELGLGAGFALAPALAMAQAIDYDQLGIQPLARDPVSTAPRAITLKNLHTDESLDAVYWENGDYVPDALQAVNQVLRDFRTEEVHPISPALLDVLTDLRTAVGSSQPFQVLSGYRSAETNAMLRERSAEVAQHSLHMDGLAIDLYLDDVDVYRLHMAALDLSRGGVGYYPVTRFIHVDVGPVRHWEGA